MRLDLVVNGHTHRLDVEPGATLLRVLREDLGLTGTKEGCLEGECGACTVLVDGRPVDSCLYPAHAAGGREVTTVEGLGGPGGALSPIQQALVDTGGVQCGFCTPGFVVTLTALLAEDPAPSEPQIREALTGNLCRCTGYGQIVDAALRVAGGTP